MRETRIRYSFSDENQEFLSEEAQRICRVAPVAEILLENYLNSIFLFFEHLEREHEVRVEVETKTAEIQPKVSLVIKVRTHLEDEREMQEITTALIKVMNETLDRITESKISGEKAINVNQKIQLDVGKL